MATTKRGTARIGLGAPWALSAGPPQTAPKDEFGSALARLAEDEIQRRRARDLGLIHDPQAPQASPLPVPASVGDIVTLSREQREAASAMAKDAREQAADERDRRERAEQNAASAYEAGKEETLTLVKLLDERDARAQDRQAALEKALQERTAALEAELRTARDEAREARSQQQLSELNAKIDQLTQAHSQVVAQVEQRAAQAEARAAAASQPKSGPELAIDLIKQGEDPNSPRVQVLLHGRVPNPGQENLEERWQRVQLESHIDDLQDETSHKRAVRLRELDRVDKRDEMVDRLVDNVGKVLDLARKAGEQYLGVSGDGSAPTSKAGLPHNNIAGTLEGIAQQVQQAGQGGAQA